MIYLYKYHKSQINFLLNEAHTECYFLLQQSYQDMNQYVPPHPPPPTAAAGPTSLPPAAPSPTSATEMMPAPSYPMTTETWPGIPAGPHMADPADPHSPPLCAGCRLRIEDKFYLSAVEAKWHSACLKCAECGVELETQSSCFERDGHIYCKEDYRR